MIVLDAVTNQGLNNTSGTVLVQLEVPHKCETCKKKVVSGKGARFSWDVYGVYFTHRECATPKLVARRPTIVSPPPEPPTIVPPGTKRKRGAPSTWEGIGWDGKPL